MERGMSLRLAFRSEGANVNCYIAELGTMEGAILIASMRKSLLQSVPGLFDLWMEDLRASLALATEEVLGVEMESFETRPAPQHERAGHA
jgi:hypothetical protein